LPRAITRERAERIARAHACPHCLEYSWKKVVVKPASASHRKELLEVWHAVKVCGVCGLGQELGIDAEGDIIYVD
jgi:transcription elongation factor Elf1